MLADGSWAAAADALIGLAADALGVGRFAASARALQRAAGHVADAATARAARAVRLGVGRARDGQRRRRVRGRPRRTCRRAGRGPGSARHTVKSRVILAAARCSSGDIAGSRREADEALSQAGAFGLIPLRWAVACLLADIGSATHPHAEITVIRDGSAETVIRRGGVWRRGNVAPYLVVIV